MSRVVELWGRTPDAVEASNWSLVEHGIDQAIKYSFMKRYLDHGLTLEDSKLHQIDLAYHNIRPGQGIFRALEAHGTASRWITGKQVAGAAHITPPTTRTELRGDFLVAAENSNLKTIMDQTHLKISGGDPISTTLDDPFTTENDEVSEMVEIPATAEKTSDTDSNS